MTKTRNKLFFGLELSVIIYIGLVVLYNKYSMYSFNVFTMICGLVCTYIALISFVYIVRDMKLNKIISLEYDDKNNINIPIMILPALMTGIFSLSMKNVNTISLGAVLITFSVFLLITFKTDPAITIKGISYRGQMIKWPCICSYTINEEINLVEVKLNNNKTTIRLRYNLLEKEKIIDILDKMLH